MTATRSSRGRDSWGWNPRKLESEEMGDGWNSEDPWVAFIDGLREGPVDDGFLVSDFAHVISALFTRNIRKSSNCEKTIAVRLDHRIRNWMMDDFRSGFARTILSIFMENIPSASESKAWSDKWKPSTGNHGGGNLMTDFLFLLAPSAKKITQHPSIINYIFIFIFILLTSTEILKLIGYV